MRGGASASLSLHPPPQVSLFSLLAGGEAIETAPTHDWCELSVVREIPELMAVLDLWNRTFRSHRPAPWFFISLVSGDGEWRWWLNYPTTTTATSGTAISRRISRKSILS